jgi:hypothetical protein
LFILKKNSKIFNLIKIKDFQNYFRLKSIGDTPLTVITFSFKTENDMATWSNQVDTEREIITQLVKEK